MHLIWGANKDLRLDFMAGSCLQGSGNSLSKFSVLPFTGEMTSLRVSLESGKCEFACMPWAKRVFELESPSQAQVWICRSELSNRLVHKEIENGIYLNLFSASPLGFSQKIPKVETHLWSQDPHCRRLSTVRQLLGTLPYSKRKLLRVWPNLTQKHQNLSNRSSSK
jgi:hypothetical protein